MFIYWLILLITLLFIHINPDVAIAVAEHQSNDITANDSFEKSWQTISENVLVRVTRTYADLGKSKVNDRQRREVMDTEEILGMARKVAIIVFVIISLCFVCCIVTIIFVCVKCCCSGNGNRKRNQGFNTIPQPIVIHTHSPNYQPQYHQQQAPQPQPQLPAQTWHPESYPMLPQPSAPPQPNDDFHMERPPAYEKIYAS